MKGIEYVLAHVQEPVLFVVRKQERASPEISRWCSRGWVLVVEDLSHVVLLVISRLLLIDFVRCCSCYSCSGDDHTDTSTNYYPTPPSRPTSAPATPKEFYYILEGTIFKAPSLYDLMASRMATCAHQLRCALDRAQQTSFFHPAAKASGAGSWRDESKATVVLSAAATAPSLAESIAIENADAAATTTNTTTITNTATTAEKERGPQSSKEDYFRKRIGTKVGEGSCRVVVMVAHAR